MIGRTNAGSGGGNVYAFIKVTYPIGSTCIATNGSKTLRARDVSGHAVFLIPNIGTFPQTWTVTSTDGSDTATQTAVISYEGQSEDVTLTYHVPSGYQEVEYLQCDTNGNQYINTEVTASDGMVLKAEIQIVRYDYSQRGVVGGGRSGDIGAVVMMGLEYPSNKLSAQLGNATASINQDSNWHTYELDTTTLKAKVDNTESSAATNYTTYSDWSIYLFVQNNNGTLNKTTGGIRIRYFEKSVNGVITARMYPCYNKTTNIAGFYDNVRNTFYTNAGSGTFIVGSDV